MGLKNYAEKMTQERRAKDRYYLALEKGMAPEDRREWNQNTMVGASVIAAVPIVALAGAATGYLIAGQVGAALVYATTFLSLQWSCISLATRQYRALREYAEDHGGRQPRPWNKAERRMVRPIVTAGQARPVRNGRAVEIVSAEA